jgi:hypothetical protein
MAFAAISAALSLSGVEMSGFGAPLRTDMPRPTAPASRPKARDPPLVREPSTPPRMATSVGVSPSATRLVAPARPQVMSSL